MASEYVTDAVTSSVIAVFLDCDGTLSEDTTDFLLRSHDIDSIQFWDRVERMVREGWDPPLAYMTRILDLVRNEGMNLTAEGMSNLGSQIPLFEGIPEVFPELRTFVGQTADLKEASVELEYYLISSGFLRVIEEMGFAKHMDGIFACDFDFDEETGRPTGIRSSVSFTEKTKFVFAVNKGIPPAELRRNPYRVNDSIDDEERRVPFDQMVYVGDGPSDIPCFSLIRAMGGKGIGVYKEGRAARGYELAGENRITVGPYSAVYSKGSDLRKIIERVILDIGYDIVTKREVTFRRSPRHRED